jgi:uncharacterized membrane protein
MTQPEPKPNRAFARGVNRFTLRFARNWLKIVTVIIGIYASLPIIAPVLMAAGATAPARVLYTIYSPFCHQFAFRSLFLFGDQAAYPRGIANTTLTPFEPYAAADPEFIARYNYWFEFYNRQPAPPVNVATLQDFTPWLQFASRDFVGNAQMGYKTALCARDMGIYLALFGAALIYNIPRVRQRLRPIPIWLYVILGLAPIGIDGFSQLLGYPPFNLWSPRETTPIFRIITGLTFGLMTGWLAFPHFEIAMRETREQIELKFARAGLFTN